MTKSASSLRRCGTDRGAATLRPQLIKGVWSGLALAAVLTSALYAKLAAVISPHLQQSDCASCHLAGKGVTTQTASLLTSTQEALCAKCHPAATTLSHPSGFQPKNAPPPPYALDWKGELTCSTCHDIHAGRRGIMRGEKVGREFCQACHDAGFFKRMRDGGASLLAGHLAKGVDSNAPELDPYSRKCMECHGENANPRLATRVDRQGVVRHATPSANHPIGMSYQKAATFGGYRERRLVERRLMLPGGQVGCVSCHSGYQKEHGKLVVPKEKSALCFECHDL
ncbi:cytochrome c3 family protein [Rhodoferax sp.]|uniref:cytochrome c3 family protein n=1 Tax=Rhodoferax sp. TaxID=50421 RepID=UPI002765D990|nr:cytochrome c3 family protein [Rhodoferax sp.]